MTDITTIPEAFYVPAGIDDDGAELFLPTDATRSVWSTQMQHGSPPAALMVRAMERLGSREDARLTRVVMELLGPVPVTKTKVSARIVRPGRKIELLTAELSTLAESGEYVLFATASAWRMTTVSTESAVRVRDAELPELEVNPTLNFNWGQKGYTYADAIELRWMKIADAEGPSLAWARVTLPLVQGEETTPLQNAFNVVDAANGLGATLDPAKWIFLNTDLTVHLHRAPRGEWTGVSAESSIGPDGIGMCAAVVHDEDGPLGRSAQSLLVRER